jgi:long-chain acyl-CoA synthetase
MDGVRLLVSGASALPPAVFQQFQTITGLPIWEGYGLTECSPVVTSTLVSGQAQPGSVGRPIAGVEVSLRDTAGNEVDEGDPGELWVKGRSLLRGYWPGSPAVDDEGWFHTGDVAILDEDGDYRLVDRRRDLIIVSGFNVYPREIEAVLATHPAVAEVAVVGVAHPLTGETVKAVVVLRKGVPQPDDLRAFCEARLARFKCPAIIEFVPKLPRAVTGKVTKGKLKDRPA